MTFKIKKGSKEPLMMRVEAEANHNFVEAEPTIVGICHKYTQNYLIGCNFFYEQIKKVIHNTMLIKFLGLLN